MIVVFNPTAGRRRARLLWRVLDILVSNGVRLELAETRHAGHAVELARQATRAGGQLVVAAGGDGTVAEVANGLAQGMRDRASRGEGVQPRLGIIPLGTANVLAHELGLPFAPREVAAALAMSRTRLIWPGHIAGLEADGGQTRVFVQMLGVGFDAQVVHRLSLPLKRAFGRGAYVLQTLRELGRYSFTPIGVRLDGVLTQAASVIVTKGHFYAGRYLLAPGASPVAPGFTVALFSGYGPFATMMYGAALPLNLLPRMPGVRLVRASRIEFMGRGVPAQSDGDDVGAAPMTVTDAPGPIAVVVG